MRKIDYTTMNSKAPAEGSFDKRWWLLDEKERPQTIVKIVKYLSENDSARQLQYQTNAKALRQHLFAWD
jgi:ABC-type Zn2+ transport system substrate-binding protein/surface adhesin